LEKNRFLDKQILEKTILATKLFCKNRFWRKKDFGKKNDFGKCVLQKLVWERIGFVKTVFGKTLVWKKRVVTS